MADGSIIIDTRIDTGGVSKGMNAVKAGMARISAQVSKMGDSAKSSFQRQITAITGLYQNYEKQERKVSELKSKLEELSKVRIETEEYKKLKPGKIPCYHYWKEADYRGISTGISGKYF